MGISKKIIKFMFRVMGYEISRKLKPDYTWLKELNIKTIIDIGANDGQYAIKMRKIFPQAKIFSFEPVKKCFLKLEENFNADKNFKAFNIALGERPGKAQINRNEFTPASSILKVADLLKQHFSYAIASEVEDIKIEKLDDVISDSDLLSPIMIKIDVQGFEDKVIKGGVETIKSAKIIIIETSFRELYEGQPLFDNIYKYLTDLGFIYHGSVGQIKSNEDRRVLQEDSVFVSSRQ